MSAAAVESKELREYEMIYILRSSTNGEEAERVLGRVRDVMDRLGGTLVRIDNWGRRKLAYPIDKSPRGVFVLLGFVSPPDLIAELERTLGLLDSVIRTQTIVLKQRVSLADYQVDDAEVAFAPLEDEPESDEPTLAARLGLVERPRPPRDEYAGGDYNAEAKGDEAAAGAEGAAAESDAEAAPEEAAAEAPAAASEEEGAS